MFTDIVGYTALMGRDERKAFETLNSNRELQKPIIEEFDGRFIKELGDGILASFVTVSDAIKAAIKIQQTCNVYSSFKLRIGIDLGEVIFENGDVFGDGVNIASRIQAIANPGSIFISGAVHNSISNKNEFVTRFFKEERLKNVKEPVKVYQVIADNVSTASLRLDQKISSRSKLSYLLFSGLLVLVAGISLKYLLYDGLKSKALISNDRSGKSIAVLPFINASGDSSREYFTDGISESLMTDLGEVPGLLVIARNSVFQYKDKQIDPVKVGEQLNVHYILQGKVQQEGENIRINTQLIETERGVEVWAKKFDARLEDVFLVEDSISKYISRELQVALEKEGNVGTTNIEAYDNYLKGYYLFRRNFVHNPARIDSAITLFEKATTIDPQFALAYAAIAKAAMARYFIFESNENFESKAFVAIQKALSLDPNLAEAYVAKGNNLWTLSNGFPHEKAINEWKHAVALNPNLVEAHESLGSVYFHIGLFDKSMNEFRTAIKLDPTGHFSKPRIARIYWYQQKFDSALSVYASIDDKDMGLREKALVLWYKGKKEEAFKTLQGM
jgi:adenylate cyclase